MEKTKGQERREPMRVIASLPGIAAIALTLICGMAYAIDNEISRQTLKGLKGVYVLVEPPLESVKKEGLTTDVIRTDVELKLRLAGIPVLSREECLKEPGHPCLYVDPHIMKSNLGTYIYNTDLEVTQLILLERSHDIRTTAATWSIWTLGTTPNLRTIRHDIKDQVDKFINAYLSVNPKK
jgi:hypothetical protein